MVKTLTHIGVDDWGMQVYRDNKGQLWKDIDNRENCLERLYDCGNEFDGEPGSPMKAEIECEFIPERIIETEASEVNKFKYQMLSRLQSDCDYFLGYGNGSINRLWAGNVKDQIKEMKEIWNRFPENQKPEWLTMEQILLYELKMNVFVRN